LTSEATEIAKVIDAYVKAYQTAELDQRVARVEQFTDAGIVCASRWEIGKAT
jgi:iron uptake system EfeUOB component EfeO/EfeM